MLSALSAISAIANDIRRAPTSRVVLMAGAALAATALTACSAGQVSQVAMQEPAVNGTTGNVGDIALRNVHIQAVQTTDALEPGTEVDLVLTASNESPTTGDRLVGITTDVGTVELSGDTNLPATDVLMIGTPDGITALSNVEVADAAEATVTLDKPIQNGLTYDFTFEFEKAGETTLAVPISAGNAPRQEAH